MLRLLVLVLLLANIGYYAWSQGHLAGIVSVPPHEREPERLRQQVRPDAIRLGPPASPSAIVPATP